MGFAGVSGTFCSPCCVAGGEAFVELPICWSFFTDSGSSLLLFSGSAGVEAVPAGVAAGVAAGFSVVFCSAREGVDVLGTFRSGAGVSMLFGTGRAWASCLLVPSAPPKPDSFLKPLFPASEAAFAANSTRTDSPSATAGAMATAGRAAA